MTRSDLKTLAGAVQGETSACIASKLRAVFSAPAVPVRAAPAACTV
ncbi:MAG TPA: hypothetical protein VK305_07825 [Roseateles sp.]|nr:hypothetical protein [Roseateles sp.]